MANVKIKILVSIAGSTFSYAPGEEAILDSKEADRWIAAGIAEKIADEKAPAKKKAGSKKAGK